MDPERWRKIEKLYESVVERSPADRAALLAQADPDIRAEVEALLAQPSGGALLDQPAANLLGESGITKIPARARLAQTPAIDLIGMSLSAGDRLGPFEILGPIGKGGMGEVYKARDSRLNRN